MQSGQGNFGGWHHPQIFFVVLIKVVSKFRQLSRSEKNIALHHEWSVFLCITLLNMYIQHPGDQRSLQAGTHAAQHIKA